MTTPPAVDPEILHSALETFKLEGVAGANLDESLAAALAAGILVSEQKVLDRVAAQADNYAREFEAENDEYEDGISPMAATMGWFASKIREELPAVPSSDYEPAIGDVVEVTITGEVVVVRDVCHTCGIGPEHPVTWSIVDDITGVEVEFPYAPEFGGKPKVRVLSRVKEKEE